MSRRVYEKLHIANEEEDEDSSSEEVYDSKLVHEYRESEKAGGAKKPSPTEEGDDDITPYDNYMENTRTIQNTTTAYFSADVEKYQMDASTERDVGVILTRMSMSRKNRRKITERRVLLQRFRYDQRKVRNGADPTPSRGMRQGTAPSDAEFCSNSDLYSDLEDVDVYGFDLDTLLDALSVGEGLDKSRDKRRKDTHNKKRTNTDETNERFPLKSNQILRLPLIQYHFDFETFYPRVAPSGANGNIDHLVRVGDEPSSANMDDYIFSEVTDADLAVINSNDVTNKGPRLRRSLMKNRILPVYFLPMFLAAQSPMIYSMNPPLPICHLLLQEIRNKPWVFQGRNPKSFEHARLQLEANFLVTMYESHRFSWLQKDILEQLVTIRHTFTNFSERLKIYDYELYQKMMSDPNVVSSISLSNKSMVNKTLKSIGTGSSAQDKRSGSIATTYRGVTPAEEAGLPARPGPIKMPYSSISYEKYVSLFRYFEEFMIGVWEKNNKNIRSMVDSYTPDAMRLERMTKYDMFIQYMSFDHFVDYEMRALINKFRKYMSAIDFEHQLDENKKYAKAFFNELERDYNVRYNMLVEKPYDYDSELLQFYKNTTKLIKAKRVAMGLESDDGDAPESEEKKAATAPIRFWNDDEDADREPIDLPEPAQPPPLRNPEEDDENIPRKGLLRVGGNTTKRKRSSDESDDDEPKSKKGRYASAMEDDDDDIIITTKTK